MRPEAYTRVRRALAIGAPDGAASGHPGGTFSLMPQDRSPQHEPDQPTGDDPLAGLRKLASLAKELGVTDVASFTEMLESARNEGRGAELFKPLKALVDQFSGQKENTKSRSELGARLMALVAGRETVAEMQYKTEIALLRRIEELSSTAPIEGVVDLATAYARLCSVNVVPGEPIPDDRRAGERPNHGH